MARAHQGSDARRPNGNREPDGATDRGQAIVVVVAVCVLIAVVAVGVASMAARIVVRSRTQAAADAIALAAAGSGRESALHLAGRWGVVVSSFAETRVGGDTFVVVVVEVDGETAQARASTGP